MTNGLRVVGYWGEKLLIPVVLAVLSYLVNSFIQKIDSMQKDIKEISVQVGENRTELAIIKVKLAFMKEQFDRVSTPQ